MSETTANAPRTAEQIEADLEATRLELTRTVDELVAQLQPSHLMAKAKEDLSQRFVDAKTNAVATVAAAREGDSEALRKVGIAAASVVGAAVFLYWRFSRKK